MAAGGIVIRESPRPLIGIVRLRKEKAWVLPKGKLKPGESVVEAAKREVEEETGHGVTVLEFLGSLSHAADGRHKIVQFWHMRASNLPVRALTSDVKSVKWLPLRQAIETLTRPQEKVFLSNVGPAALTAIERSRREKPGAAPVVHDDERLVQGSVVGSIRAWLRRIGPSTVRG